MGHSNIKRHVLTAALPLTLFAAGSAQADLDTVRFGVPPWPGVTVKSEVATQILEAMGYQTQQNELAVGVILSGLANDDLDVYLGGWYPIEQEMIDPLVADGKVDKVAKNISNANSGLVVPEYVHEAGVDSVADLDRYKDRFDGEIQGIERVPASMTPFSPRSTRMRRGWATGSCGKVQRPPCWPMPIRKSATSSG